MGTIRLPTNGAPVPRATAAPDTRYWSIYIPCGGLGSAALILGKFTRRPGPLRRFFLRFLLGIYWGPTPPGHPPPSHFGHRR